MRTDPTFSIVVPTFRRPDALEETLAAILRLDYRADRYQVIVVDDGADDALFEGVEGGGHLGGRPSYTAAQPARGIKARGLRAARCCCSATTT